MTDETRPQTIRWLDNMGISDEQKLELLKMLIQGHSSREAREYLEKDYRFVADELAEKALLE